MTPRKRASIRGRTKSRGVSPAGFAELAGALPGVEAGTSHGVPVWRVGKKIFALYRETLASVGVIVELEERDVLMEAAPETFHLPDHYRNSSFVMVRLDSIRRAELAVLLEASWRSVAPAKLVAQLDAS